jgi:2-polyprenyl-6-methoxyphenol hydroxylase-like FAD-dependent oxidoreductase
VVLIGDAAGYSNPLIGQGLSVSMRDVRVLSEALTTTDDWSLPTFEPFTAERNERMRRLRHTVEVFTDAHIPLGPDGLEERRRRMDLCRGGDMNLFMSQATVLLGPDPVPAEAFDPASRDLLLSGSRDG